MKTCFKCGVEKPCSEFYKHAAMGDGYLGKCKTCTKADTAARVSAKQSDPDWVVKEAERCREKGRKVRAEGREIKQHGDARAASLKRWNEKHSEKRLAHNAVSNAIRDGRLLKKPCERCGNPDSEGHHDDYSKPLDVKWLCPKHHAERHVQLRDEQRRQRALARALVLSNSLA